MSRIIFIIASIIAIVATAHYITTADALLSSSYRTTHPTTITSTSRAASLLLSSPSSLSSPLSSLRNNKFKRAIRPMNNHLAVLLIGPHRPFTSRSKSIASSSSSSSSLSLLSLHALKSFGGNSYSDSITSNISNISNNVSSRRRADYYNYYASSLPLPSSPSSLSAHKSRVSSHCQRPWQSPRLSSIPKSYNYSMPTTTLSKSTTAPLQYYSSRHYFSTRLFASNGNMGTTTTINNNDNDNDDNDNNDDNDDEQIMSSLTEQLSTWLIQGRPSTATTPPTKAATATKTAKTTKTTTNNTKKKAVTIITPPMKACLAIAGGGSKAASSIASVPGASSLLLESIVPYDRLSFAEFVTRNDDGRLEMDVGDGVGYGGYGEGGGGGYGEGVDQEWLLELETFEEDSKRGGTLSKSFSAVSSASAADATTTDADADAATDDDADVASGQQIIQSSTTNSNTNTNTDDNNNSNNNDSNPKNTNSNNNGKEDSSFHFCSAQAAILLSRAALHRSMSLSPSFQDRSLHCTGVGCTSSLVGKINGGEEETEKERRMRSRKSRAYIAVSTLKGGTCVWEVELSCGQDDYDDATTTATTTTTTTTNTKRRRRRRRTRAQEETIVSNLILLSMIQHREGLRSIEHDAIGSIVDQILDREGDSITERYFGRQHMMMMMNSDGGISNDGNESVVPSQSPAVGAQHIINGDADIVAVLPVVAPVSLQLNESEKGQTPISEMKSLFSDNRIPLPRDVLIVPGSFNPPHHGHVALANAAVSVLRRLRESEKDNTTGSNWESSRALNSNTKTPSKSYQSRYSSLSSVSSSSSSSILNSIWNTVQKHSTEQYDPTILFEMSVTNADKPPLDPSEVERRLNLFLTLPNSGVQMPRDWGVILTNAPLFSQKTSILNNVIRGGQSSMALSTSYRKMSFVLGSDTMVRIINPKYYGNSRENMIAALVDMKEMGVHFIVGGRLEQGTQDGPKFVNGEEEIKSLPSHVQCMFTILKEEDFRVDVSSTELRKKLDKGSTL